jgi:uracil-DNA glycosylase family 4
MASWQNCASRRRSAKLAISGAIRQTVFGEGANNPAIVLIGEQPGNQEDLQGKPFVGPAGKILDQALEIAGLERQRAYITHIVKHFKSTPNGKLRIHKKPRADEIEACRPWLDAEIALLKPNNRLHGRNGSPGLARQQIQADATSWGVHIDPA